MQTNLDKVLSYYLPRVAQKHPAKVEAARATVTKHWDATAERKGFCGMTGQAIEICDANVMLVLRELAGRKPEFAAELKAL